MSNKDIVGRHIEALNAKDMTRVKRMVSEQCTLHSQGKIVPYAEVMRMEQEEWKEHPQRKYVIDELLEDGDKVAARCTMMDDGCTPTLEMLVLAHLLKGKFTRFEVGLITPHS